jgi:hypothetical protein
MSLRDQLGATKTAILVEDCLQSSGEEETSWGSMS